MCRSAQHWLQLGGCVANQAMAGDPSMAFHVGRELIVANDLEPKIKDALPSVFGSVSFKTFSLGEQHPEIREIGVAHGKQNQYDGLELDLKIIWNCNADIVVDVQGIEIGIENIRIDGGVQITMMSPPNISWNFRGIFAALQADVVSRVMRQVVPNLIFVHWLDSEADVDLEVLQFPHPDAWECHGVPGEMSQTCWVWGCGLNRKVTDEIDG
eukprot:Skav216452  [mRNA]  locus=scaffold50:688706:696647:- [translate_table: standard]